AVAINETWMPREALQDMFFRLGQDRVQRYETGSPATIVQAWGRLGDDCALPNDEAYAFYTRAQQERAPTYQNRITLQSVQNMSEYNPDFAIHLASPTAVLIIHSKHDLIPVSLLQDVYQRALEPKKILVLDCKHTDLYDQEPWLTRSADAAIEWFRSHLQHHDASGTPPERREEEGMTIEQNKEIMRRMIDEIWNNGNLMTADELFSPTHTSPSAPDLPPGPQSVKMLASMFRNAMPDYHMNIDLLMADEDSVVGRFTQSGTHTGAPLMGLEPSGRKATWTEIGILRIAGGKVVESWYEVDMLAMMNQLNPQAQAA
ncbi:MAG TPA: ester cyclase, partial [Trueperaceae bacterium]